MIAEHAHFFQQCSAGTTTAFLAGLVGHFLFDAGILVAGFFGFPALRRALARVHDCAPKTARSMEEG